MPNNIPSLFAQRDGDLLLLTRDLPTDVASAPHPVRSRMVRVAPNPSQNSMVFHARDHSNIDLIQIYDIRGRLVQTVSGGHPGSTMATITWDGKNSSGRFVSEGIYFGRVQVGDRTETHKLTIVR